MKRTTNLWKRIIALACVGTLALSMAACSGESEESGEATTGRDENVDLVVDELFDTNFAEFNATDEIWITTYVKASENAQFAPAVIEKIEEKIAGQEREDGEAMANALLILDALGYQDETVKAALVETADAAIDSYTTGGNYKVNPTVHLSNGLYMLDGTYYDVLDDVLPEAEYEAFVNGCLEYAFGVTNAATINDILVAFCNIKAYPEGALISPELVMNHFVEVGELACVKPGMGGYYDGGGRNREFVNNILQTVTERYTGVGDFAIHYYDEDSYLPTGEHWEKELMESYDESRNELVYKDIAVMDYKDGFLDSWWDGAKYAYVVYETIGEGDDAYSTPSAYIMLKEDRLYIPFVNGVSICDADFSAWIDQIEGEQEEYL